MKKKNSYLRGSALLVLLVLFAIFPVNAMWIINHPADCTGSAGPKASENTAVAYIDENEPNYRYTSVEGALAAASNLKDGQKHKVVVIPQAQGQDEKVVISHDCVISENVELVLPYGTAKAPVVDFADAIWTSTTALNSNPDTEVVVDSDVTITVLSGGTLTLNGQLGACDSGNSMTTGRTYGQYSQMELSDNASIEVQSGGTLNCWGLIREVNKKQDHLGKISYTYTSGLNSDSNNSSINVCGTLNLPFTVYDWQGGAASVFRLAGMDNFSNNTVAKGLAAGSAVTSSYLFPLEKFDCPNIWPKMNFSSEGILKGQLSVVRDNKLQLFVEPLVGQTALITYKSGTIVWDFETDIEKTSKSDSFLKIDNHKTELCVEAATGSIGSLEVQLQASAFSKKVNTSDFFLRLGPQFSIVIENGSTFDVSNKIAILPGCSFMIDNNSKCTFSADAIAIASPSETGNFKYYDYYDLDLLKLPKRKQRDNFCPYSGTAQIINHGTIEFDKISFGGFIKGNKPTNTPKQNYVEIWLPNYQNGRYYHVEKCKNSYKYVSS